MGVSFLFRPSSASTGKMEDRCAAANPLVSVGPLQTEISVLGLAHREQLAVTGGERGRHDGVPHA